MYLSELHTGQIFYEVCYGKALKFIALEDPHLEGRMWTLKAMNMATMMTMTFQADKDAQHYLRLEPEHIVVKPGLAFEWEDSHDTV